MKKFFNHRGQNIIDYSIIISIVAIALATMQPYIRRGIQATIKVAADQLGPQYQQNPQTDSRVNSETSLATSNVNRLRVFEGGSQQIDYNKSSTSDTGATYISLSEE